MSPDRIAGLLAHAPVFDGHNDLAWELRRRVRYDFEALDIAGDLSATGLHTDIPRLRAGGVGAQFWSVYVPCHLGGDAAVAAVLEQVDAVRRLTERYPADHAIACSLGVLRMLYALGVRYLTLTHVRNTPWADSATDSPGVGGLSPFGHEVVREMNRLGMLVDLSHVAPATMHAALDTSVAPAFFSHSSARALCDHPRNVPDDVLRRVADSNGVVMVTFVPGFLTVDCRDWTVELMAAEPGFDTEHGSGTPAWYAARDAWVAANPPPPCGVSDVADHVSYVREVAGVEHVGLGGDFDGVVTTPRGLSDVSRYPALLAELAERGWSDHDLARLTWQNAMRVFRDTEAVGREVSREREPSAATYEELDAATTVPRAPR